MYSTQSTGYCCIKNPTLLALVSDMVEIKAKTSFPRSQSERKKALHLKGTHKVCLVPLRIYQD